jgi:replicative DNA helicase
MLEKHGIAATQQILPGESSDEDDLNRAAQVFVPEVDYERAHRLFYAEREDEL